MGFFVWNDAVSRALKHEMDGVFGHGGFDMRYSVKGDLRAPPSRA